jgi:putative flavoprotein involved in K+ transport
VFEPNGYPVMTRGITEYPGLYFLGLPFVHNAKSGLLFGVGEDAEYLAGVIAARAR